MSPRTTNEGRWTVEARRFVRNWSAGAAACAGLVVATGSPGLARAAVPHNAAVNMAFTASAVAQLVGISFTTKPGVLFDQLVDAGASQAQSNIDSLGQVNASAAEPYPSGSVIDAPTTIGAYLPDGVVAPQFPTYVQSSNTHPKDHKTIGQVELDATSVADRSQGTVTDGATNAVALTTHTPSSGLVAAHAASNLSSISTDGLVNVKGVHSKADFERSEDGVKKSSSFEVGSISLLGQQLQVTGSGLSLNGTSVPFGVNPNDALAPVLSQLATQGVTLTYIPATSDSTSVTSGGLRVDIVVNFPPTPATGGIASAVLHETLGLARASVDTSVIPNLTSTFTPLSSAPGSSSVSPAIDPGQSGAILGGDATGAIPDIASPPQSPTQTPQVAGTQLRGFGTVVDVSLAKFYPVFFLAALAGVGFLQFFRSLGVRNP